MRDYNIEYKSLNQDFKKNTKLGLTLIVNR